MASLFRPVAVKPVPKTATITTVNGKRVAKWTARGGKPVVAELTADGTKCRVRSPTWWVEYTAADGTRQRVPGFRSRDATLQLAARLTGQADDVRAGRDTGHEAAGPSHMVDHLPGYRDHLIRKGNSAKHVAVSVTQVRAVIDGCGLTTPAAVDPARVERWLDREADRHDWGAETRNRWRTYLKGFGNWLVREKKARFNPFAGLTRRRVDADRRLVRRVLTDAEFAALVRAARESPGLLFGLSGPDRAVLYLVAAYTGRRLGVLLKMTPEAFVWEGEAPTACVSSGRLQKSKRPHVVPLHPDLARQLAPWLRARSPGRPLWAGIRTMTHKGAEMVRCDLAAARAAWVGEAGPDAAERARRDRSDVLRFRDAAGEVFDFHSLRGQFVTSLARAGVPLTAAQKLADHSDPKLTANIYTKWSNELAGEIARLPAPPAG